MAEATHTTEFLFDLNDGGKKGDALYAGIAAISDTETIDTGLDKIEAVVCQHIEAAGVSKDFTRVWPKSISGGVITFTSRTVDLDEAVDGNRVFGAATDKPTCIIAVGCVGAI